MKKVFLVSSALILASIFIGGFAISLLFSSMDKSAVILDKSLLVQGNDYGYELFNTYSNRYYIASFTVLNGTIEACYPLPEGLFQKWQQGQYEPTWAETNLGEYKINKSADIPQGYTGAGGVRLFFFAFKNEDYFMKEVRLQVTEFWQETNYAYLAVGILLMVTAATGFVVVIVKNLVPHFFSLMPCRAVSQLMRSHSGTHSRHGSHATNYTHNQPCQRNNDFLLMNNYPIVEARRFSSETRKR